MLCLAFFSNFVGEMETERFERYHPDEVYGERLLISNDADKWELADNIRAARAILQSFPETIIVINEHRILFGVKNPEYIIDQLVGDRKGVLSERGIRSSFEKGKKQGCQVIVIDLDMHLSQYPLRSLRLSKELYFRRIDFHEEQIKRCYIVYHGRAALLTKEYFIGNKNLAKELIRQALQKIAE